MSDPAPPSNAVPLSLALRIEKACVRFEATWKAGQRPRIEDYLADFREADWPPCLREQLSTMVLLALAPLCRGSSRMGSCRSVGGRRRVPDQPAVRRRG
jgi:hypothetical protein